MFGLVICFVSFKSSHLGKDSGKDKFSKGREEEKSPVETKDVDHLDENLPNKIHQIWIMMFSNKIIGSFEPASKRSPCFVHTSQTGNWSQGKQGRTSAGTTRSDLYSSVGLPITWLQRKTTRLNSFGVQESPSLLTLIVPLLNVNSQAALKKTIIQHQFF